MKTIAALLLLGANAFAANPAPSATPTPGVSATEPVVATENTLEVRGQNRASSLLLFKKEKFQIKFIRIRKDYNEEILNTPY